MKRGVMATLTLLAFGSAIACMWDMDTLADEARNKMDFVRIITGRFERNPPLYYQMRLDRVAKELKQDPSKLDNYDNAAVACDRIGNDKDAIVWIEKKRAYMQAHRLTPKTNPDDWYRFYANEGTFYTMLWLRDDPKSRRSSQIQLARDLVAKALEINPNSHFGRERVHLKLLDWAADRGGKESLAEAMQTEDKDQAEANAKGLAGLIKLGNAWESPDVFDALKAQLSVLHKASVAELAEFRASELLQHGAKTVFTEGFAKGDFSYPLWMPDHGVQPFNREEFTRLRAEADQWQAHRTEFMMTRLKAGRHPDIDPDFWNGYTEAPAPEVRDQPYVTTPKGRMTLLAIGIFGFAGLCVGTFLFFVIRSIVREIRRAARRKKGLLPF